MAFASLDVVETLLEPGLDGFDLGDGLMEEGVDLLLHLDIELKVVFLELDGLDSLVHLPNQQAELLLGRGFLFLVGLSSRLLGGGTTLLGLVGAWSRFRSLLFRTESVELGSLLINLLGQIFEKSFKTVDDVTVMLLKKLGNIGESFLRELFRNLFQILLLAGGLKCLLELLLSLLVLKQTLNLSSELLRKNSLVILPGHRLHVDGKVEVPKQPVNSSDLLLGYFLGILGHLLLSFLRLYLNGFEIFELTLLDASVSYLHTPQHPSPGQDLAKRSSQFLDLGVGARRLGIVVCGSHGAHWSGLVLGDDSSGGLVGNGHGVCGLQKEF